MSIATIEKPNAVGEVTAKPTAETWSRIDSRCKPSKCVSRDGMRPVLNYGYIRHEPKFGGSFLFATDSYVLVALPITMDPGISDSERSALLPEVGVPLEALKLLDNSRSGEFRIVDDLFEVADNPALFGVDRGQNPPNFRELLREAPATKRGGESLGRIGLNPSLLKALTEAMGATQAGVALGFNGPLQKIRVEPLNHSDAEGLLMPVRLRD